MKFTDIVKNGFNAIRGKTITADSFLDPISGRGGSDDRTMRMVGQRVFKTPFERMKLYQASGFIQNIIEQPAEDATREFIDVTTNRDDDLKINRMIEKRLDDLNIRKKLKDLVRLYRMYEKGSMMYFGVDEDLPQTDAVVNTALDLSKLNKINYINVIEEPDRFYFFILNRYDPTKADYNKVTFYIMGKEVHESRIVWIVNNWYPLELMGISILETVESSVNALESALWSTDSIIGDMATTVFESDLIASLSQEKRMELLYAFKQMKNTQSVIGLKPGETYTKQTFSISGIKEAFEFICDCVSAVSRIPKKVFFGQAHGIVGAAEFDVLDYFANIGKFQELELRPILKRIIDMIVHEKQGEIYKALAGNVEGLDVDFTFETLYKMAPADDADMQLKLAQRDDLDINNGKISPSEARTLDPRMDELKAFETDEEVQASIKQFAPPPSADLSSETTEQVDPLKIQTDPIAKAESEKGEPDVKSNFGFRDVTKVKTSEEVGS